MPASRSAQVPSGRPAAIAAAAKAPRNPVSRAQIETVVSRSVAIFGLVFGAETLPVTLGQAGTAQPFWFWFFAIALYGGLLASAATSFLRRFVRFINTYIAVLFLIELLAWPLIARDPLAEAADRPWLWFLCNVATAAAVVTFSAWMATTYVVVIPLVYGVIRLTPSGGGMSWQSSLLDVAYAIILGSAILILVTLLRQASSSVDAAQATALERYGHAVRQHATELERVQVDSIVHDSVLTTLLSAARADTPEAKQLATSMARNAMGHLRDAASASPDDDAVVSTQQLAHRIIGATATLSAPFEVRARDLGDGTVPVQPAEAVYSAAVQAMVNSLQHAGEGEVKRWLALSGLASGGIQVDVGDTGVGFAPESVPAGRLGLRVSILERVANAGGLVEIESAPGDGTVVSIRWPAPDDDPTGEAS
jgi:signal transduction histidine kinase